MTPDEARKLDNKKCLIFIRGFDPIIDTKFIPYTHPAFSQTSDGKGEAYVHTAISRSGIKGPQIEILSPSAVMYYEKLKSHGENVYIDSLKYEELLMIGKVGLERRFTNKLAECSETDHFEEQQTEVNELANVQIYNKKEKVKEQFPVRRPSIRGNDTITNRLVHWSYSEGQKEELKLALRSGIPKHEILDYFYPDTTVEEMKRIRNEFKLISAAN